VVRHRLLWILAVLCLLATSCAGGSGDVPAAKGTPTSLAAEQTLVVGTPADTFNTEGDRANLGMFPINANIFENLVRMTPDFQVEPWLAERWEHQGNNTWRFSCVTTSPSTTASPSPLRR
jgi:ABC-type transport system substrate-binding protein